MPLSAISARGQYVATVTANIPLCDEHFRLVLSVDDFPATDPGQFIQIACHDLSQPEPSGEWDWSPGERLEISDADLLRPVAMLRRPFSLAGRRDRGGAVELDIIHRVVGVGTAWMADLKRADRVGILGPLGNRFALPATDKIALLVGGGVGIPPMLYLAQRLRSHRAIAFCGATRRSLLPLGLVEERLSSDQATPTDCIAEFAECGIPSVVSTDDGSAGFRGFVTQALELYLDQSPRVSSHVLFTCGPEPMMKRVADIAARRGLECQIAVERAMACGMGTCQSCCIRVKVPMRPDGRDWVYRLACTDGPVFKGSELLW
ncbi:MAG TPA: dihydroorotate dehydrogenase electron transfer subunit [Tepidisphaeraceae bacterium]|nr:dihydroorotate dehydrogenase electron transfer subunit [Tepidisphaeraceae bacterium]